MFSQLEDLFGDWDKTEIFQVDERVAPAGDDQRNLTHLIESLSIGAQGSIKPMPVTDEDLDAAAARYAESLPERLDIAHLGIGPDGHTASLVPGDPVLEVTDRRVAVTSGDYQGVRGCVSLTRRLRGPQPALGRLPRVEVDGAVAKRDRPDPSTPSWRVSRAATLADPGGSRRRADA
jgi:6-phosphogluconolactonase